MHYVREVGNPFVSQLMTFLFQLDFYPGKLQIFDFTFVNVDFHQEKNIAGAINRL
jgi:hypothetical protein